jgi:hypothetical protein
LLYGQAKLSSQARQWAMGNGQKNITIKKVFGDKEPKDLSLEECKKAIG